MCPAANGVAVAGVDDRRAGRRGRLERGGIERGRQDQPPEDPRAAPVDPGHVRVVVGEATEARRAPGPGSRRRGARARANVGFATRSASIVVVRLALTGPALQKLPAPCVGRTLVAPGRSAMRASERCWSRGERVGQHRPEQVRPPDRADEQAAAGEDRLRAVGVLAGRPGLGDEPGEVLGRVAGRRPGRQPEPADLQPVALVRPAGARTRSRRAPARRSPRRSRPASRARRTGSRCGRASRGRAGRASRAAPRPRGSATRRAAGRRGPPRVRWPAGTSCRRGRASRRARDRAAVIRVHPGHPATARERRLVPCARWRRSATRRCSSSSTRTTCSTGASRRRSAGFEAGFMVSEHFHPWTPQQGQAAFAWAFMGALGLRTSLRFGTAVTFPGFRYHPAVVAHAAATLGAMFPGRFWLGLGAGEALNEHILGLEWPEIERPLGDDVRVDRDHLEAVRRARSSSTGASTSSSRARSCTRGPTSRSRSTSRRPGRSTPRRPASSPRG